MNYPFPQTDREIASKQLAYLGYTSDQVYLRFFYHSKDKRKDSDKGRKLSTLDLQAIENYQQQGRGVYLVVNGNRGGHEDKDITQCTAIFCEWDDRPIEDQLFMWENLGFIEPTFTVYSGDKSAQPYWVFDEPISVEQWRELQRMLISLMKADPINKNPSRVFRLAGGWHVKPGREPKRTEIVQESGQKYSYQAVKTSLEALLEKHNVSPVTAPAIACYENIKLPVPQTVPLEICLSKDSRSLLESGSAHGERNGNGAKLARDLIGTASYLEKLGQAFAGDPWHLFIEYCHHCPPGNGWSEGEWQNIWNGAQSKSLTPSCTPDGVDNCVRAWYWKNYLKNNTTNMGFSPSSKPKPSSTNSLCDRISKILNSYDLESDRTAALMDLAGEVKKSFREIERLAQIVRKEGEMASEVVAAIDSFASILKNCRKRLDIRRYLDPKLAQPLLDKAEAMPTAPEYLFNTLLPACASRIGTSARIIVNPSGGYTQDCIFWTANVAHSGQAKTPPQKEVIAPLEQMEKEAKEIYDVNLTDYEKEKSDEKQPVRMRRLLSNTTTSTKIRIHGENPRGLLEYIDELVADYQRLNQYKGGGKGDDLQLELSFFNGCACNYDRHDARLFLSRTSFSKTGTYQWDTLAKLMNDDVNFISSGYSARFLYCSILDAPPRYLDLLSPRCDSNFSEILQDLYGKLESLPERDYLLSHEAKVKFQAWNHALADDEGEENYYGFSLVYPKIEAYTARIALWLHIVNAVLGGDHPQVAISAETMQRAIEIASFYLWQQKLIHANNAPSRKLEGVFFKVQMQAEKFFAKYQGGLNASFLKTRINALKTWTAEKIRTVVFKALESAGHGRTQGQGSEMKYFPNTSIAASASPQLVSIDEELVKAPIDQSFAEKDLQPTVGEVGDLPISQQKEPELAPLEETQAERREQPSNYHQSTNNSSQIVTDTGIDTVDAIANLPPTTPTDSFDVTALLLQCQTWVEIAQKLQRDSRKLAEAMRQINKEQRRKVASLLIESLCREPQQIKELNWLPVKMLYWVFERLNFTVSRIGGESIVDARVEKIENLSFVSVEKLGTSNERWVFRDIDSSKNIPVFDSEAICAISLKV